MITDFVPVWVTAIQKLLQEFSPMLVLFYDPFANFELFLVDFLIFAKG